MKIEDPSIKQKLIGLFEKMKAKNFFWSYADNISPDQIDDAVFVETVFKYGDVEDIRLIFACYEKHFLQDAWSRRVLFDDRFKKLNFYLAKIFFDLDPEQVKRERKSDDRGYKLRMLAAKDAANLDPSFNRG